MSEQVTGSRGITYTRPGDNMLDPLGRPGRAKPMAAQRSCPWCGGLGHVYTGPGSDSTDCWHCRGTGDDQEYDRLAAEVARLQEQEQRVLDRVLNLRQRDAESVPLAVDIHAILRPTDVLLAEWEADEAALDGDQPKPGEGAACGHRHLWPSEEAECRGEGAADQPQGEVCPHGFRDWVVCNFCRDRVQ